MRLHLLENRDSFGWATFGGYWPQGAVRENRFQLTNERGEVIDVQSDITARWADGSVRWSRHVVRAESLGGVPLLRARLSDCYRNHVQCCDAVCRAGRSQEKQGSAP